MRSSRRVPTSGGVGTAAGSGRTSAAANQHLGAGSVLVLNASGLVGSVAGGRFPHDPLADVASVDLPLALFPPQPLHRGCSSVLQALV